MNYAILGGKIITSRYVLDIFETIEKGESTEQVKKILIGEFQKLILQGKITFAYLYANNPENRLRGRVGRSSGFRIGTQRLLLIPNNKWPKIRSKNITAIRYYDQGRASWRSLRKDHFVVATSFFDERDQKWKDNPYDAGFSSNWNKIKNLNILSKHQRVGRPDTPEELQQRIKINKKEASKRKEQIRKTQQKHKT